MTFIERELPYARQRLERLRGTAVAHVAADLIDTEERRKWLASYLEMQRERCLLRIGELQMLAALCRFESNEAARKECEALDGELWRLANGCNLAALELRYPMVFETRRAA